MMKAGKYYIGDLCYVMSDEEWNEICDLTIEGHICLDGEFTMDDGRRFAMYRTEYGDGEYDSNIGTMHPVDSGSIGCILVDDIRFDELGMRYGAVVEFDTDFETSENKGIIRFGHVSIDTEGFDFDDEEYDEEY